MRKFLLSLFICLIAAYFGFAQTANAQTLITGKLLDAQTKEPLIGASVLVKGTTVATSASLDGSFKIAAPTGSTLVFSYIGYVSKELPVTGKDLGEILLDATSTSMKEIEVSANSLAINRQTPIAASSVGQVYIEEKGAGAEFPELLKETPSVTVSRQGGGYGDSRINIRGFGSNNVALLLNGIPMNDVQAGKIYWSDFAGLTDVTTSMQVQRGLSATDIAVPSVGGTINISTMSTQTQEGGTISQQIGSYDALKTTVSYSTGLNSNGWSSSFLLAKSSGTSPGAVGLYYSGYSYFLNISKVLGTNQTFSFNILGASQTHAQRYTYNTISTYRLEGPRFNTDYGYYGGKLLSDEQNFYSQPLASINHNWKIDDKSSLSTVVAVNWGSGAARYLNSTSNLPRLGDQYSPINFDAIAQTNAASPSGAASNWFLDNENDHVQASLISTYKRTFADYFHFLAGVDLRYFRVENYYKVDDLLSGAYVIDTRNSSATSPTGNINNPNGQIGVGGKFNNDFAYQVQSEGGYLQTEYIKNNLSAFVNVAGSETENRRTDYFNYAAGTTNQSAWVNFLGFQAKGGVNYNIDAQNNVYVNGGYIQRAPLVATIFVDKKNDINPNAKPEKLLDYELGYHFQSPMFSATVSAYNATYRDRAKITTNPNVNNDGSVSVANISGINERHEGVEFEGKFRPTKDVTFSGSFSVGNFYYLSNTGAVQVTSDAAGASTTNQPSLLLKDLKVGDFGANATGAQNTAFVGLDVNVMPQVKIGADYTYYSRYYGSYDPTKITATGYSVYQIPDYGVMDANIIFRFKIAGLNASFIGNVYNLFNTLYIADAYDTTVAIPTVKSTQMNTTYVWYGAPRYYMTTIKIKF